MSQELKALAAKIREGAKEVEICRGEWTKMIGSKLHCCTLSSAAVACNPDLKTSEFGSYEVYETLSKCLGIDLNQQIQNPEKDLPEAIDYVIVSLTDDYCWSRTRIASYLEHYEDEE